MEKTLERPLDCKEIHPVHSKGDQSLVFIRRTEVRAWTPKFQVVYLRAVVLSVVPGLAAASPGAYE